MITTFEQLHSLIEILNEPLNSHIYCEISSKVPTTYLLIHDTQDRCIFCADAFEL